MEHITRYPDGSVLVHHYEPMASDRRPQDPTRDGASLTFETLEHGGACLDAMPQAIRIIDSEGRSCLYFPAMVDGQVVNSQGFELFAPDRTGWGERSSPPFPSVE